MPADPTALALDLGISTEAVELYRMSEVVDLHLDMFIWTRVFGYDLTRRHGNGPFNGRIFYQTDIPRLREARIGGGMWSITTNPFRSSAGRARAFTRNLARLRQIIARAEADVAPARTLTEYQEVRAQGKHAALISIQGGNALDAPGAFALIEDDLIVRITLVHLSTSTLGATSAPQARGELGLTDFGREVVAECDRRRILVDLAHISRPGFFDAVEVHDASLPLIVTHTGVDAVTPHWRNLTDDQLRAIAQTGGTIGVMYQASFLGGGMLGCDSARIVDHLAHIIDTVGEDHASLGSDWDGFIAPPWDMPSCLELPRLVQHMLDRGWSDTRIQKVLGGNALRVLGHIRP